MVQGSGNSRSNASPFVMDARQWPFVRITSPLSDVNVDSFFEIIDSCLEKRTVFGSLHDIRGLPALDALQRKKFSDYIKRRGPLLQRFIAAHGVVVRSNIERGIVTAVLWVSPVPFPVRVFDSTIEAEKWVRDQIAKASGASR